jgi:hypothetical protein
MEKVKQFFKDYAGLYKSNLGHMIFTIAVALLLGAMIFGGGSSDPVSDEPIKQQQTEVENSVSGTEANDSAAPEAGTAEKGNIDDYYVEILSSRLGKDYDGNPVIIVKYNFTNNGTEPASFMTSVNDTLYQGGIELEIAFMMDDSYDGNASMLEIKNGATLEVELAYVLRDTTSPVEVEVTDLFGLGSEKIAKTFEIA